MHRLSLRESRPPGDWEAADFLESHQRFYPAYDRGAEVALLDRLGLPYEARLGTMSTGEIRRVQIVGALAAQPELLVADEITAVLDILGDDYSSPSSKNARRRSA